jgi:hypothetical protein
MAITVAMRTEISQLYVSLFGRAPDGEGLGFWVTSYDKGTPLASIAQSMYDTAPARAYYPLFATPSEIVTTFYTNVLGRAPDAEGLAFWVKEYNASSTQGAFFSKLISNVVNYNGTDAAGVTSKSLFANKVAVAQYYGEQNGNVAGATSALTGVTAVAASVDTAKAAIANTVVSGQTFTLSTNVDTISGTTGNDTIVADNTGTAKQLTVADTINGGNGTDTLRIFLAAGDTSTGQPTTLTSVESVYINGGAITAYTANSGTSSLSIEAPVEITNATYTLSGQSVTLKSTLAASAATAMTTTLSNAATTTAMTVNLDGYTNTGTNTHTLALVGTALATATLNTTATSKITSLTNSSAALTTLNLTGTAGLTLTDTLTGLKTYNATGTTGAVTLDVSGKTPSTTFSYTGSDARDILTFGSGAAGPKSTMTIIGGGGATDKLVIKDVETTSNTAGINKATGFEYLGLGSGTANSTYDMSLITSMSIVNVDTSTGATPATTATAASGTAGTAGTAGIFLSGLGNTNSVIVDAAIISAGGNAGANTTSAVAGAVGGAGAVGLTLTPAVDNGSNAITITLNGVTINSKGGTGGETATGTTSAQAGGAGGAGAISISATSHENVTLISNFNTAQTATNALQATGGAGAAGASATTGAPGADAAGLALGTNATLTITGAAALNAGLISGTNVTINAAGMSGNLTFSTGTGNDVITGGSGVNTITLTGGVDTVNLAASTAKADVIAFTSGTGTSSTSFVKISNFTNAATTGDKLDTAIASVTIQADVAAGTATGVANLTAQVSSGIMTFAGSAAATATLANKVTGAVAAAFAGGVGEVVAFEHAGNTYIFANVATANAFDAGDQLIELTGLVGLASLSTTASSATGLFIS